MNLELNDFVESSFRSIWSVELLLLLYRQQRKWSAEELVSELRSSEVVVTQSIEALVAGGLVLVEADGRVCYSLADPANDLLVQQLNELYRKRPGAVRKVIVQNPADQLRTFSDAFSFRKI